MQEVPPLEIKSIGLLNRSLQVILILSAVAATALCWYYAEIMLDNSDRAAQRPGQPWLRLSSALFGISAACSGWLAWLAIRRSKRAFGRSKHLASLITAATLALFAGSTWNLYVPVEPLILVILFWLIVSHGWNWKRLADTLNRD